MMKIHLESAMWLSFVISGLFAAGGLKAEEAGYLSPLAIVADSAGKVVYVAEATARQVAIVDAANGWRVRGKIDLPGNPSGLALAPDGSTLYVTEGAPAGKVHIVSVAMGRVSKSIGVGHTPCAPVVNPDGKVLYVCNRFDNNISVIDLISLKELARIAVDREPVAECLTSDGKILLVANHVPKGASDGDFTAAVVSVIDTGSRSVATNIGLPNGSSSLKGICLSPDGRHAYVTHVLSHYQLPTTQLERGWMNANALSVIDVEARKLVNTVLVDDVDLGAANPWGVACSADGRLLLVAHAGTHEISVIDRQALHERLARVARGEKAGISTSLADVPNDLSFLSGIRQRVRLPGNGPRALCVAGDKAVVGMYFSDELAMVALADATLPAKPVALGPKAPLSQARTGEMFFNDARLCFQKWQSCASCHPDGRADGLNWDLLNDGIGNPKNTRNMLLCFQTPPSMSLGVRESASMGVRAGLKFILFAVHPEEDALAIDEYLKEMKPVSSPLLVNGKLSKAARRGKKVFEMAGCAACHPAPLYTDLQSYDIGMGAGMDQGKPYDTPTLVECWRTAPYFYDGRAYTMKEALSKFNKDDKHGHTGKLSPQELDDLVEFVLSL